MRYVDGYVLPVARKHLGLYLSAARKAGRVWRDHGALEYRECVGEDLKVKWGALFPRVVRAKPGETVVFSWIVFKSRAHRDRVNAKVMKDERMKPDGEMPFSGARMIYGGFATLVDTDEA